MLRALFLFTVLPSLYSKGRGPFLAGRGTSGNAGTVNVTGDLDTTVISDGRKILDRKRSPDDTETSADSTSSGVDGAKTEVAEEASNCSVTVVAAWISVRVWCLGSDTIQAAGTAQPSGCFGVADFTETSGNVESGDTVSTSNFVGVLHVAETRHCADRCACTASVTLAGCLTCVSVSVGTERVRVKASFDTGDADFKAPVDTGGVGVEAPVDTGSIRVEAPFNTWSAGFKAPVDTGGVGVEAPLDTGSAGVEALLNIECVGPEARSNVERMDAAVLFNIAGPLGVVGRLSVVWGADVAER